MRLLGTMTEGDPKGWFYSPLEPQLKTNLKSSRGFIIIMPSLPDSGLPAGFGDWAHSCLLHEIHTRGYMPSPPLLPTTQLGPGSFSPSWPFLPGFFTWSDRLTYYTPVCAALFSTEQGGHVDNSSKIQCRGRPSSEIREAGFWMIPVGRGEVIRLAHRVQQIFQDKMNSNSVAFLVQNSFVTDLTLTFVYQRDLERR